MAIGFLYEGGGDSGFKEQRLEHACMM